MLRSFGIDFRIANGFPDVVGSCDKPVQVSLKNRPLADAERRCGIPLADLSA
jgi:hypothetical protein